MSAAGRLDGAAANGRHGPGGPARPARGARPAAARVRPSSPTSEPAAPGDTAAVAGAASRTDATLSLGWLGRRLRGAFEVDPWGGDPEVVDVLSGLTRPVLRIEVDGVERLPAEGPAVLVCNRRLGIGEPLVLLLGLRRHTGRLIRPVGIPDVAPVGSVLRRFGAVQTHPAEIASLLRAGETVAIPLGAQLLAHRAGRIVPELLAPALVAGVPVVPVAAVGGELTGRWRVVIGRPVEVPLAAAASRTPLALAELAERARVGVQVLLDDAFPSRWWLPT